MSLQQLSFPKRMQEIRPSPTVVFGEMAAQRRAQGLEVFDLTMGEPDFDTPGHIVEAAQAALQSGLTHYVNSRGIPELREAIVRKLRAENGLDYDPAKEVLVTVGGKQAIFATIMATIGEGDEVLIMTPMWVSYDPIVRAAGGIPIPVPLDAEDSFRITEPVLASHLSSRTKMIILNSPNNPTGRVATQEELEAVAAVAAEANLLVISDEIYEKLLFDGREHVSVATLPGMRDRTVVVNGLSKSYAMTGWRLGYLAGPAPIVSSVLKIHQHSVTCANAFVQKAGVAALAGPQAPLQAMLDEFAIRRDLVLAGLNSIPGVTCPVIEGTFYAFPGISAFGSSEEVAQRLVQEGGVAVVPGVAFGESWNTHLRLSFAASRATLERALEAMKSVLQR
jgi:aspartate aminotransferase